MREIAEPPKAEHVTTRGDTAEDNLRFYTVPMKLIPLLAVESSLPHPLPSDHCSGAYQLSRAKLFKPLPFGRANQFPRS